MIQLYNLLEKLYLIHIIEIYSDFLHGNKY